MSPDELQKIQSAIIHELSVKAEIDPVLEIRRRVSFLMSYLVESKSRGFVLGISGGIDSSTAGRLGQLAVQELRQTGYQATFTGMRLPYGVQRDEVDAQNALAFIEPDHTLILNIKAAADELLDAVTNGGTNFDNEAHADFILGNIKARQRMIAQYAVAGAEGSLVIGTDHAAEAVMGFFTKFGDGACDLAPLAGLSKRQVRSLAKALGAPDELIYKVPTADLETLAPLRPDEAAFGITYEDIDDFLEGKIVSTHVCQTIARYYQSTVHKRALPVVPT